MFRIETEKELLGAFRSRDRKYVELPKGTRLPLHKVIECMTRFAHEALGMEPHAAA